MINQDHLWRLVDLFYVWHNQGRVLPGYEVGNCIGHLWWLFGMPELNSEQLDRPNLRDMDHMLAVVDENTVSLLLGPNGWSIYQILLARRTEDA